MYVVLWRFRPLKDRKREFERAYGPSGEWTRLFQHGEGYLGTELLQQIAGCPWQEGLVNARLAQGPLEEEIPALAEARQQARDAKDFAESDRLRDEIAALGWEVRDVAGGFELVPKA